MREIPVKLAMHGRMIEVTQRLVQLPQLATEISQYRWSLRLNLCQRHTGKIMDQPSKVAILDSHDVVPGTTRHQRLTKGNSSRHMLQHRVLRFEKRARFERICDLQYELFTHAIRKQKVL